MAKISAKLSRNCADSKEFCCAASSIMKKARFAYCIIFVILGVIIMTAMSGCAKEKYKLIYDGYGFESKKTEYAAGEKVTVYFDFIATDTDYYFSSPDVELKETYDEKHGYIFTFTMPDHDVTLKVESRNSMMYDPDALGNNDPVDQIKSDNIVFDYYEATVATVGGDGYDELVLYTREQDAKLILARYGKWGEGAETCKATIVPHYVLDECMAVVEKYQIASWNEGSAMAGKLYVVKFWQDGNFLRVSSDVMPMEDGPSAFGEIANILGRAWADYGPTIEPANNSGTPNNGFGVIGPDPEPQTDPQVVERPEAPEGFWYCPECGALNDGNFCKECGRRKPEE